MNNKDKNIRDLYRGINEFKRDYQQRNNFVKDENGDVSKEVGLEINIEKTKYMLLSCLQNVGQNRDIKQQTDRLKMSQLKYLGTTVTNQNLNRGN
jgi:predicted site-specific integrase-resolvase